MRKLLKRIIAAQLGILLATALIGPIQAERFVYAVCTGDTGTMLELSKDAGLTQENIDFYTDMRSYFHEECQSAWVRGIYVDETGLQIFADVTMNDGTDLYLLQVDPLGKLESIK